MCACVCTQIHLQRSSIYDYSGVDALNELGAKYKECGKTLHVKNLNVSSTSLIRKMDRNSPVCALICGIKSNFIFSVLIVADLVEHFTYHIDEDVDNVDEVLDRPLGLNVTVRFFFLCVFVLLGVIFIFLLCVFDFFGFFFCLKGHGVVKGCK